MVVSDPKNNAKAGPDKKSTEGAKAPPAKPDSPSAGKQKAAAPQKPKEKPKDNQKQ